MMLVTNVYRGKIIENFHIGYAVAVNENGENLLNAGDPEYPVFLGHTLNPFVAAGVVEAGAVEKFNLSDEELATIASSHNGETEQTDLINTLLKKVGLTLDNLKCGIHTPLDKLNYEQLIIQGRRPTALHNCASGVHAGMLTMVKSNDGNIENYTFLNHPVQQQILEIIKKYADYDKIPTAITYHNTPDLFLPLNRLARMYQKLMGGADDSLSKIMHLMSLNPKLIAGKARFDSDFTNTMKGKGVSKSGMNGVKALGVRTKDGKSIGIAIKVLSGDETAADSMAVAVLDYLKLLSKDNLKKIQHYSQPTLHSYTDEKIGHIDTILSKDTNTVIS